MYGHANHGWCAVNHRKNYFCQSVLRKFQSRRAPLRKKPTRAVKSRELDVLKFRISITVGFFEFFSDQFKPGSALYSASPVLVTPRRKDRFKRTDSGDQCPDDFQYDDGTPSLIEYYTPA
jgi:hypothetical protein